MSNSERIHVVVDLGNRVTSMKVIWLSSGRVENFNWPSMMAFPGYEIDDVPTAPNTAYLSISEGPAAAEWGNQTIIVGEEANQGAVPVYKFNSGNGKITASLFFLLGMIPPLEQKDTVYEVIALTVLHPEPKPAVLAELRERLAGSHGYKRSGVRMHMTVHADAMCLMPEGLTGYYYAVQTGQVDPSVTNAFLDIGGLTTDIGMVDRHGPIRGSRRSLKRGGVQALAMKIAEIMTAKAILPKGSPDTRLVLDGLDYGTRIVAAAKTATGAAADALPPKGQRYPYGSVDVPNPIYFDSCVDVAKKSWLIDISGEFDEVTARWESQHAATVVLGGGAYYIPDAALALLNQSGHNFVRAQNAELANLEGAALLRDPEFLKRFAIPTKSVQIGAETALVPSFALV